ncbi:MAG: hypothetical protein L6Q63_16640, partial [Giesbergeria sp.]|nr:hypothetical protein [Giesbergeria sp.]
MRYELEPDNRNCPDAVLLGDLRAVASRLGKSTLTKDEYNKNGRFSAATMQNRFGSWNSALLQSNLSVGKRALCRFVWNLTTSKTPMHPSISLRQCWLQRIERQMLEPGHAQVRDGN